MRHPPFISRKPLMRKANNLIFFLYYSAQLVVVCERQEWLFSLPPAQVLKGMNWKKSVWEKIPREFMSENRKTDSCLEEFHSFSFCFKEVSKKKKDSVYFKKWSQVNPFFFLDFFILFLGRRKEKAFAFGLHGFHVFWRISRLECIKG